MAVNVSTRQLIHPAFVRTVAGVLAESGIAADRLVLEIAEIGTAGRESEFVGRLEELRALGVALSIDDFGAGHSSLANLTHCPVQTLKISRAFVHGIPDESRSCAIVRAIIMLGNSLGINVIAEGVETAKQREFLAEQGCPEMQGYLISPPIPPDTFASLF